MIVLYVADQHRAQRQLPYAANERPAKRSHISPLHQAASVSGDTEQNPIKPSGTATFSFGTTQTVNSTKASQFTHTTTTAVSSFSTASGFGSTFPTSAGR